MTTKDDIRKWLSGEAANRNQSTHMLVICDTFDYSDYPVFCASKVEALARIAQPGAMQRVMEVYNLHMPIEPQLAERRAWHVYATPPFPIERPHMR